MGDFEQQYITQDHNMLRITPNNNIVFTRGDNSESTVEVTSIYKFPVTYKIQTTSPQKFRVRPRCGVLQPGEIATVSILLKPEYQLSEAGKDKFLVMCSPIPEEMDTSIPHLTELWKQKPSNSPNVEQHRLCCVYKSSPDSDRISYASGEVSEKESDIVLENIIEIRKQMKLSQWLHSVSIIFLIMLSIAMFYVLKFHMGPDYDKSDIHPSCPLKRP